MLGQTSFGKNNLIAALVIGGQIAILFMAAVVVKGWQGKIPFWWGAILTIPLLCSAGLFLSFLISRRIKVFFQLAKFILVGGLNTLIDFGVLNLLMFLFNAYKGGLLISFNATSFFVALINSYFWNKLWAFKTREAEQNQNKKSEGMRFAQFVIVSLIGVILNTSIVYCLTTFVSPFFGLRQSLWANLAKMMATLVSLAWNFLGYKFIVFGKNSQGERLG